MDEIANSCTVNNETRDRSNDRSDLRLYSRWNTFIVSQADLQHLQQHIEAQHIKVQHSQMAAVYTDYSEPQDGATLYPGKIPLY